MATERPIPPERWALIEKILDEVLDAPPAERAGLLARVCAGDADLRREVETLLEAEARAGDFLETPASVIGDALLEERGRGDTASVGGEATGAGERTGTRASAESDAPVPGIPRMPRIARYRLLREIGRGGMGVVYEAEQENPRRAVAVKVILGEAFAGEHDIRLFEREAHALGRLRHPGIAAILEAGRTEQGQHFFAMELVRGKPLDRFLRESGPAAVDSPAELRSRLALFLRICDAINYAHQRGVIHRDIKPSNILALKTETPEEGPRDGAASGDWAAEVRVSVLDFGIARITDPDLTFSTITGDIGRVRGTLPYMSPEQARGDSDAIDVRSDLYSLGVVLYEMLTGERPYDLTRARLHDAVRQICEEPPKRPSTMAPILAGDVETVLLKALEKDPARRYPTVSALAEDLARFVRDEPILARPPSTVYQIRKLVARHRLAFAFAATMAVLVVAFGVTMAVLFAQQSRLRARAETEGEKARRTVGFLTEMLSSVNPQNARGPDVTMREILDEGSKRIAFELETEPEIQASLQSTIGVTYRELGFYDAAEPHLRAALDARRTLLGADHADVAASLLDLGSLYWSEGRYPAAESLLREAISLEARAGSNYQVVVRSRIILAAVAREQGRFAEAESLSRDVVALTRDRVGEDPALHGAALNDLAVYLMDRGRFAEAETLAREAVEILRTQYGEGHPDYASALGNVSNALIGLRRLAEAESLMRIAASINQRLLGADHPTAVTALASLSAILMYENRTAEAESTQREVVAMLRRRLGSDHPSVAKGLTTLSGLLVKRGELLEGEKSIREALAIFEKRGIGEQADKAIMLVTLGFSLRGQGRLEEARDAFREALAMRLRVLGPEHGSVAAAMRELAVTLQALSQYAEAESLLVKSLAMIERTRGKADASYPRTLEALEKLYDFWGKPEKAKAYRAEREALAGAKAGTG